MNVQLVLTHLVPLDCNKIYYFRSNIFYSFKDTTLEPFLRHATSVTKLFNIYNNEKSSKQGQNIANT